MWLWLGKCVVMTEIKLKQTQIYIKLFSVGVSPHKSNRKLKYGLFLFANAALYVILRYE